MSEYEKIITASMLDDSLGDEVSINIDDVIDVSDNIITYIINGCIKQIRLDICIENFKKYIEQSCLINGDNILGKKINQINYIGKRGMIGGNHCLIFYEDIHVILYTKSKGNPRNIYFMKNMPSLIYESGKYTFFDMT